MPRPDRQRQRCRLSLRRPKQGGPAASGGEVQARPLGAGSGSPPPLGDGSGSPPPLGAGIGSPPPLGAGIGSPPPLGAGIGSPPPLGAGIGSSPPLGAGIGSPPPLGAGIGSPPPLGAGIGSPPPLGAGIGSPPPLGAGIGSSPPLGAGIGSSPPMGAGIGSPPPLGAGIGSPPPMGAGSGSPPPLGAGIGSPPPLGAGIGSPPPLGAGIGSSPPLGAGIGSSPPMGAGIGSPPPLGAGIGSPPPMGAGSGSPPPLGAGSGSPPPLGAGSGSPPPLGAGSGSPPPYYLANFLTVLDAVLRGQDAELLNQEDGHWIRAFRQLSAAGQKLYVRLFQRKLNWLKVNRLNYAEIASDLGPIVDELALAGLVQTGAELHMVSDALDLLSAPELKLLAKRFHLQHQGPRWEIHRSLLHLSKQQSIFGLNRSPGLTILNRVKEMVGQCVRVAAVARAVFSRALLLFSLTESMDGEDAACAGQNQLSTILMVNMGQVTFPSYTVFREARIFRHRDDLLWYEAACHTLAEVGTAMVNKAWEDALHIYKSARKTWNCVENSSDIRFFQELPVYLRCFTAGWVYTRIRFRGVEILQRLHMYKEAVEELRSLLDQNVFCPDSRGHWWDRLTMNLHQHLKQMDQAIHCLREGMADTRVHTGHRLALQQRAQRIRDSPSCKKWHHLLQELPKMQVEDVPHVTIKGRSCPGMGNALFLMQGESHSTVICSVEAVSVAHYQQQGFDQGIHGEGATFLTLFGLLFWEIIFLPGIPDVFRNPFQTCPLDLYTDDFYQHRREPIESRLRFLQDASTETLHALIANVWNNHKGTAAALVNWEIFSCLQQAQSLVSCLGGLFLSGICKILAEDLRHCRGGLPDLVVWNSKSLQYKLAEVKGPSDHLSHKQTVWLDRLQKLGAAVEVCHVSAVGGRGQQLS